MSFACVFFLPGHDASLSRALASPRPRAEVAQPAAAPVATSKPSATPAPAAAPVATKPAIEAAKKGPRQLLREWLETRLPAGGKVDDDGPELVVTHTVAKGETLRGLASSYLELTTAYSEGELLWAMMKANPRATLGALGEGTTIRVPMVVKAPFASGDEARLGWPAQQDGALRGVYASATLVGHPSFPAMLDRMVALGMNAVVIDAKDVTGFFTYPSKIPLALATDADAHATVTSFAHLVQFAHARGVRVIARIACFRDENLGPRRHDLAVQKKGGGAHVAPSKRVDWLDPANETVQSYLLAAVDESLAAGADEIQLDYVRYPTEGVWDADFHLEDRGLTSTGVITDFVRRVHERTQRAHAPLSLDVFGVVAWHDGRDVISTGQDLRMLAPNIEALSPMVYPSHFSDGFNGYQNPADHADVVGIGTTRAVHEIEIAGAKIIVRPWVQAFPWKTTSFGSRYVADQLASARKAGAVGWLAWNSGGEYGATFAAASIASGASRGR